MQRDDMLAKVEAAYQARRTGDFAALEVLVSADASFTYGGEQSLIAAVPAPVQAMCCRRLVNCSNGSRSAISSG